MQKNILIAGLWALGLLALASFVPVWAAENEPVQYTPDFTYTPAVSAEPGSIDATFAVGNPNYHSAGKLMWFSYPPFNGLNDALKNDLCKIFSAKGFKVRGPFDSYDLIPYQDKKAIELYAVPSLELSLTAPDDVYSISDIKIEAAGKLTLELRELQTKELMWIKTVPIPKFVFTYVLEKITWKDVLNSSQVNNKKFKKTIGSLDIGKPNMPGLAKGLEQQYPIVLDTLFKLIDPEEMLLLKKQVQELKQKSGKN